MKLITVIEDTCGNPRCAYEHGLCIYVETKRHKLLFDTGATAAFAENAGVLGIPLEEIDTVVLSHGHYDHGGGLRVFREYNHTAQIYMQREAVGAYYHGERYIGIDKRITALSGIHLLDGDYQIDEELRLFSGIKGRRLWPQGNRALVRLVDGQKVQDNFSHEQCLAVSGNGMEILLSGCAHNGILNVLDRYERLYQRRPDAVISGFHMMKKSAYDAADVADIEETARELRKWDTIFYTGHCTGQYAFDVMHSIMGGQLRQMHSGEEMILSV